MSIYGDDLFHINPNELLLIMKTKKLHIIDIREPYELIELPCKGTLNIPLNTLLTHYQTLLKKEETYYILCHHGQRSYYVTDYLSRKGYNVINVIGGVDLVN